MFPQSVDLRCFQREKSQSHHQTRQTRFSYLAELSRKIKQQWKHTSSNFTVSVTGNVPYNAFVRRWKVTQTHRLKTPFFFFLSSSLSWKQKAVRCLEIRHPHQAGKKRQQASLLERPLQDDVFNCSSRGKSWRLAGRCFCLSECWLFPHSKDSAIRMYLYI